MLPTIDGYEFVKMIRGFSPELPILMITAKDHFDSKHKSFGLGIDDYMTKPVDTNEIILRINALFKKS